MKRVLLLLAIATSLTGCAGRNNAKPVRVATEADGIRTLVEAEESYVYAGEPLRIIVTTTAEPGTSIESISLLPATSTMQVLSVAPLSSSTLAGKQRSLRRTYNLTGDVVGSQAMPLFEVRYRVADSRDVQVLQTETDSIFVAGTVPRDTPFRDDVTVIDPPRGWLYWTTLGLVGVALLYWLATWVIGRMRARRGPLNPLGVARADLRTLKRQHRHNTLTGREAVEAIDAVLRRFLAHELRTPTLQPTSEDLQWTIAESPRLNDSQRDQLRAMLSRADRVKYAGGDAEGVDVDNLLTRTKRLIGEIADRRSDRSPAGQGVARHV